MTSTSFFTLCLSLGIAATGTFAQTIEVTSTGVGIGTTTPEQKFHLYGSNANSLNFLLKLSHGDGAASGAGAAPGILFSVNSSGDSNRGKGAIAYRADASGWDRGDFYFLQNSLGNLSNPTFSDAVMIIKNAGNVGIGTTAPTELLTLGTSSAAPNLQLARWAFFGQEASHLTTVVGGNVKVSGNNSVVAESTGDGYRAMRMKYDEGITFHAYQGSVTTGNAIGYERMRIATNGDVGIGTTSPDARLTVDGGDNTAISVKRNGVANAYLGDPGSTDAGSLILYDSSGSVSVLMHGASNGSSYFNTSGNFGIGTTTLTHKLTVAGTVRATSFISDTTTYADFVFKPGYKLAPLSEVEAAIQKNGHLPDIPSEAEAKARGVDLGEMQVKLLQKVEELTLYLVAHEKELQRLRSDTQSLPQLRAENESLRRRVSELEKR